LISKETNLISCLIPSSNYVAEKGDALFTEVFGCIFIAICYSGWESTAESYHKNLTKKLQHHFSGGEESLKYFISNPVSFKSQLICWVLESENDDF
jgi:hypothetical protein